MRTLEKRIQDFYDRSTNLWLDTWGEHMHHGYYSGDTGGKRGKSAAQIELIEEMLQWGNVEKAESIFDAGCGVGGSARYLAKRFDAHVYGVTLSPVQEEAAQRLNDKASVADRVQIEARNMLDVSSTEKQFDLIWSMESAEHIRDKSALIEHFYQLLKPGGTLLMATWCIRKTQTQLTDSERVMLERLYNAYHLPPMNRREDYEEILNAQRYEDVKTGDWSDEVAPFWNEVIKSALEINNVKKLLLTGWGTIKGAWAMRYMRQGYRSGLIRYITVTGRKPV
jgi:tocopherol O-methyltransferase